ncbi:ABC-F family ATP-binding cassette domain-containing protein [Actinoplanes oblitus]|uniref:ABC-F family ATP-binding cassette domain-containing protein n=1 Tax=Actinoplanes oblitus TaxID=3040509 RepID=A0ABY8WAV7_9ACTN|nr:ABC-F family ATP-binding cassette domain-containing protein [Actinoplanes oblitus]WIM94502.1 ABC-F family ATP-binding cassette domain-containing protein [Actinoplanes oblitus]
MSNVSVLHARDLVKVYGDRVVLDGVSLSAGPGQRLGLVGENGIGKSTLLRLLSGAEEPDAGDLRRPADTEFLRQELPFPADAPVRAVVDDALAEFHRVRDRLDELGEILAARPEDEAALAEYGDLLGWAQDHDLWDADHRAKMVLDGLGLSAVDSEHPLGSLSGGQRTRLGLAALLIRQPRAMLLDEPTNHLDDEAVTFLESRLAELPGAVVVASHDRAFLDAVCTDVVDLDPSRGGVTRYGGTYSDYLGVKRTERVRWEQQYETEQKEIKELRQAVATTAHEVNHARSIKDNNKVGFDRHGGRVQKQISRRVRNAQQRLDELTAGQVRRPPAQLSFTAALTGSGPHEGSVSLRQVRVDGRLAVDDLTVAIGDRLLITGPNGAGKSTLLRVMAGQLAPDSGMAYRSAGLRVALLEQDVEFPDPERSAHSYYREAAGDDPAVPLSRLGLLAGRDAERPVGQLSTGQRRRVALAVLVAQPPDVLLLDEPTNHLSLRLVEELEEALSSAPGGVVVASHDRWLRRGWQGPELALLDGRVRV